MAASALLAGVAPAFAHNATVKVVSDPLAVSVSRPGVDFFVAYKVTVKNESSRNDYTYDFIGKTTVTGATGPAIATFVSSSTGTACDVDPADPTVIRCLNQKINKRSTKAFTVTFKSPSAGTNLRFELRATSSGYNYGTGSANTPLITTPIADINTSFETFVTTAGGTFFTGSTGNGGPNSPGGVATSADPFTTTLIVPPISFTTTAKVFEPPPDGQSCSPWFTADGCFETDLQIPSAPGAFQSLTIYLRIDRTKIVAGSNIANVVLKYAKDPAFPLNTIDVQSCAQTGGATSGNPCILARNVYGLTIPARNSSWYLDWELVVQAVDNGRWAVR
jgi:hypothetical protein